MLTDRMNPRPQTVTWFLHNVFPSQGLGVGFGYLACHALDCLGGHKPDLASADSLDSISGEISYWPVQRPCLKCPNGQVQASAAAAATVVAQLGLVRAARRAHY